MSFATSRLSSRAIAAPFAALALSAGVLAPRTVHAEGLPALAARVAQQWQSEAAVAHTLPARFLFDDEITTIVIPEGPRDRPCLTVAAVAARGMSTELWFGARERAPEQGLSRSSNAGIVELRVPCGMAPRSISLGSHAGRGAVELVAVWHRGPLTPLAEILGERASGEIPTPLEVGPVPWPNVIDKRVATFEANVTARGMTVGARHTVKTVAGSATRVRLTLEPGCHSFRLFTEIGVRGRRAFVDLDADLMDENGLVLARDRSDAVDASLDACVASAQSADLIIGATPADADVILASGHFALSPTLPLVFGREAAAHMAQALWTRHVSSPPRPPVALVSGGAQVTRFAQPVVPGACYVAAVVAATGQPRRLRLQISVGPNEHSDEHARGESFALVSFCAGRQSHVSVEVESRGREAAWGFSLFRVSDATP